MPKTDISCFPFSETQAGLKFKVLILKSLCNCSLWDEVWTVLFMCLQ